MNYPILFSLIYKLSTLNTFHLQKSLRSPWLLSPTGPTPVPPQLLRSLYLNLEASCFRAKVLSFHGQEMILIQRHSVSLTMRVRILGPILDPYWNLRCEQASLPRCGAHWYVMYAWLQVRHQDQGQLYYIHWHVALQWNHSQRWLSYHDIEQLQAIYAPSYDHQRII